MDIKNPQMPTVGIKPSPSSIINFTLFFKTEFSDCQKKRLFIYLLIVVLLGTVASAIIAFLDSLIPNDFEYSWGIWLLVNLGLIFLLCCFLWSSVKQTR